MFSIAAGASEESAINPFCCANLHGDDLILSKNGVFGISLLQNVQTDAHVTSAKSLAINNLLRKTSLASAAGIAYRDKYYLSASGKCFVADYNYRYTMKGSDDVQYEWFVWDNINAHTWAVVDDELWFGDSNGRICRFYDQYMDVKKNIGDDGDFTINYETDEITYSHEKFDLFKDMRTVIRTDGVYAVILNSDQVVEIDGREYLRKGTLTIEDLNEISKRPMYYGADFSYEFRITDIQKEDGEYEASFVYDVRRYSLREPSALSYEMIQEVSNIDLYVAEVNVYEEYPDDPSGAVEERHGARLKFTKNSTHTINFKDIVSATSASNIRVVTYSEIPVTAKWITPVFDFGSNCVSKTLYNLCISMNPESRGKIRFGYSTRNGTGERSLASASQWDLAKTDFSFFSFEPSSWLSYTAKVKVPRFNYIQFWFEHDTPEDCSINDFTATYSLVARNMGVR